MPDTNPYASLTKTLSGAGDAGGVSTYQMTDTGGKSVGAPLDSIGYWVSQGYNLKHEEKERYTTDYAKKYGLSVGRNSAGDPILLNPNDAAKSWWDTLTQPAQPGETPVIGPWWRFAKGAVGEAWGAVKGTANALIKPPQNPEEAEVAKGSVPGTLAAYRMTIEPMHVERQKAEQIKKEIEARGGSISNFNDPDVQLYWKHQAIGQFPIVGPMVAEGTEGIGKSLATGDVAGALGKATTQALMLKGGPKTSEKIINRLPVSARTAAELRTKIPVVPPPITRFMTETIPHGMVTRMIRPGSADVRFGKDPAQAILDEGISGSSLEDIGNKVSDRLGVAGRELDQLAQSAPYRTKIVDLTSALQPIDDAINRAVYAGDTALVSRLQLLKGELSNSHILFGGQMVPIGPRNMRMSPFQAIQYKRMIGDRVRWNQEPLQGDVNKVLGEVYGRIKDATNAEVPGLRQANERYANLVGAAKAIQSRIPAEARNANWSLSDIALAGTHHVPLAIIRHVARYPVIRSNVARALHQAPTMGLPKTRAVAAVAGAGGIANEADQKRTVPPAAPPARGPYDALPRTLAPAEPTAPPAASAAAPSSDLVPIINQANAAYNDVPPALIAAVIGQESSGNPKAVSSRGATGLMQLMPETAKKYGVTDPTDPTQNVMGGTHYLHDLLAKHNGNVEEALKDYYGRGTPPPGQPSTEQYAQAVMAKFNSMKSGAWEAGLPKMEPPPLPGLTGRTIAGIPLVKLPDSARKDALPPMISETMATPTPPQGMIAPGNIPIWNRPAIQNDDGSHSSELSVSFTDEYEGSPYYRKEVLAPLIADGRFLTPDGKMPKGGPPKDWKTASQEWKDLLAKAKNRYYNTGEMLGVFATPEDADRYSSLLHSREDRPRPTMQDYVAYTKPPAPPAPPASPAAAPAPTVAQVSMPKQTPGKRYQMQMVGANGHRIGSDDGVNWFDIASGQLFPVNVKMKPRAGKVAAAGQ